MGNLGGVNLSEDEEKKRKRAERFKTDQGGSVENIQGNRVIKRVKYWL